MMFSMVLMRFLFLFIYLCLMVVSVYSVLCSVKVMFGLILRMVKWLCVSWVSCLGV